MTRGHRNQMTPPSMPPELRQKFFDALADLDMESAAIDTPEGDIALVQLNQGHVWLISIRPAKFVVAGTE